MIDSKGISKLSSIHITWAELVSVSVHKIDAMTKVLTYLTFDHECGEYLEFTNEDSEYKVILDSLHEYLDLPDKWKNGIETLTTDDDIYELWNRTEV